MAKILIADDEEVARETLAEILRLEGYEILSVENGQDAIDALSTQHFDVLILDLKMPVKGGMNVLNELLGQQPDLAVIVFTAYPTIDTAIQALRYQVRDYILKPAEPAQVLKSIEAALQAQASKPEAKMDADGITHLGQITISWEKREVIWSEGQLSLTPTEGRLLKILFDHENEMVKHSELVYQIQGYRIDAEESAKILRPVVSRLRKKLTNVPGWGEWIKNVRGSGYVLEMDGQSSGM